MTKTAAEQTAAVSIQQLFEEQVERTPQSVAVVFEEEGVDLRGTERESHRLAHPTAWSRGVRADELVGICMERSGGVDCGIYLAWLKAGGAYVPLDPAYPEQRLAFMLNEADVRVVLTQPELKTKFPAHVECITLDPQERELTTENVENPRSTDDPANLCYAIYTSGSTGVPEGSRHRA